MTRNIAPLLLGLAFTLTASAASAATPPSNYSGYVKLCNLRLQAKVDITFGQTGTTASVVAKSSPVTYNPALMTAGVYGYSIVAETAVKPSNAHPWFFTEAEQFGSSGNAQPDVRTGDVIFKDPNCDMRGTGTITTQCPAISGMTSDTRVVERRWVGCGVD